MTKKGQAAMEFLMTYGWAILVVLAAIGALAYFGVLSPENLLPERCTGPAGLDCLEKASFSADTDNTISFALKNNLGHDINVTGLTDGNTEDTSDCDTADFDTAVTTISVEGGTPETFGTGVGVDNGQDFVIVVTCNENSNTISTGRAQATFSLDYKSVETGLTHKGLISVKGKAA